MQTFKQVVEEYEPSFRVDQLQMAKENIHQIRKETEVSPFKYRWKYSDNELDDMLYYVCTHTGQKHWEEYPYIVASSYVGGHEFNIRLWGQTMDVSALTLTVDYPCVDEFIQPGNPLRLGANQISTWNDSAKRIVDMTRWDFHRMFEVQVKKLWNHLENRMITSPRMPGIEPAKEYFETFMKGLQYGVWYWPGRGISDPQQFNVARGIDFMKRCGLDSTVAIQLKRKYGIGINADEVTDKSIIDLV